MSYPDLVKAAGYIASKCDESAQTSYPELAIVLGSGLGSFGSSLMQSVRIPYHEIPGFSCSTVQGHSGALLLARIHQTGKSFWVMQGRVHYYEGYSIRDVVFPIQTLRLLGVKTLLLTNAAGGVNPDFEPGDFMLILDHLNLTGTNPLIGRNIDELGVRFPDMSNAYSKEINRVILASAAQCGIELRQGIYAGLSGPSFETPAEIRMLDRLGADAVGMSTVAEVIAANHCGIRTAGISFISNKAAGLSKAPLSHEEVSENARKIEQDFTLLTQTVITNLLKADDE